MEPENLLPCLQDPANTEVLCNISITLKKSKGKVVSVFFLSEHHVMKAYWGSGSIAQRILDLVTRWM